MKFFPVMGSMGHIIEWARETQREAAAMAETLRAQLATARAEARKAALEEAAKVIEPKEPRPEPPDLSMYTNGDDAAFDWADHELTRAAAKLRALAQGEKP